MEIEEPEQRRARRCLAIWMPPDQPGQSLPVS